MARRPLRVTVSSRRKKKLLALVHGGIQQARTVLRALALVHLAEGSTAPQVATFVKLTPQAVRKIAHRYQHGGLEEALYDRARPGAKELLSASEKQRIVAMVCSEPPEGQARWTVRLIVEQAVQRKLVPQVGRETIRILLQNHDLQPWREKNVVCRRSY